MYYIQHKKRTFGYTSPRQIEDTYARSLKERSNEATVDLGIAPTANDSPQQKPRKLGKYKEDCGEDVKPHGTCLVEHGKYDVRHQGKEDEGARSGPYSGKDE